LAEVFGGNSRPVSEKGLNCSGVCPNVVGGKSPMGSKASAASVGNFHCGIGRGSEALFSKSAYFAVVCVSVHRLRPAAEGNTAQDVLLRFRLHVICTKFDVLLVGYHVVCLPLSRSL